MMFAGVELDVVIGHPEHDLLFVAKQVADAAGLKDASSHISMTAKVNPVGHVKLSTMPCEIRKTLINFPRVQPNAWLFTEANAYKLLLRGRAAGSEPFRKWVTEEVLPSIRKTGQYDIAKSTTPEAMGK